MEVCVLLRHRFLFYMAWGWASDLEASPEYMRRVRERDERRGERVKSGGRSVLFLCGVAAARGCVRAAAQGKGEESADGGFLRGLGVRGARCAVDAAARAENDTFVGLGQGAGCVCGYLVAQTVFARVACAFLWV